MPIFDRAVAINAASKHGAVWLSIKWDAPPIVPYRRLATEVAMAHAGSLRYTDAFRPISYN